MASLPRADGRLRQTLPGALHEERPLFVSCTRAGLAAGRRACGATH
jgi:hypothetical protein